jgi:hypothetical protein
MLDMLISDTATESARFSMASMIAIAGAAIYLTSFFLPALDRNPMAGWQCAWLALVMPFTEVTGLMRPLLFGSGLINLLVLAYFGLRVCDSRPAVLYWIALIALCLIPLSWISIAVLGAQVKIGHILWIAGLLLMLAPEVTRPSRVASDAGASRYHVLGERVLHPRSGSLEKVPIGAEPTRGIQRN